VSWKVRKWLIREVTERVEGTLYFGSVPVGRVCVVGLNSCNKLLFS
jgi:hypothetical protein